MGWNQEQMRRAARLSFFLWLIGGAGFLLLAKISPAGDVPFLRGDVNSDGRVSTSDAVMLNRIRKKGLEGKELLCKETADFDDDGYLDINGGTYLLRVLFLEEPGIPPPFPEVGIDPYPENVPYSVSLILAEGCERYEVTPPRMTDAIVRIGEVDAVPGGEVEIPIFLTNSEPVDAMQLVVSYDPRVLHLNGNQFYRSNEVIFRGTIFDELCRNIHSPATYCPRFIFLTPNPELGFFTIGLVNHPGIEIPPGTDVLVMKIKATVSSDVPQGTKIALSLTNGPDGQGVLEPYRLKNELTCWGEARDLCVPSSPCDLPVPPENEGKVPFLRGDVNADGQLSTSDMVMLLHWMYSGGPPPSCLDAADLDDSGGVEPNDPLLLLKAILPGDSYWPWDFVTIAQPFPDVGIDPTRDSLGCSSYAIEPPLPIDVSVELGMEGEKIVARENMGIWVSIPIYLTSPEPVDGIQLVFCLDPTVVFGNRENFFTIDYGDGFYRDSYQPSYHGRIQAFPSQGFFIVNITAVERNGLSLPYPSGFQRRPLFTLNGLISAETPPGTEISLKLTNGPGGMGVLPPYFLKNEVTVGGKARHIPVPPDACSIPEPEDKIFLRGDANADGEVSISDVLMIRHGFLSGLELPCNDAADANDDGKMDAIDEETVLLSLFYDVPCIHPPFPDAGIDPRPDWLDCESYEVVPPRMTEDVIRIGDVKAAPGQEVAIPVYLTSANPVEALQLVLAYDPEILDFQNTGGYFQGTIFESLIPEDPDHNPEFHTVIDRPEQGYLIFQMIGSLTSDCCEIPPGAETLVAKLVARVSEDATAGTVVSLDLTNGPDGEGVPPLNLKNELTYRGTAGFISVLPRTVSGRMGIVDDIVFFSRGDANDDGEVDISDAIFILDFLFLGGKPPDCEDAADVDDSGTIELTDVVVLLNSLFLTSVRIAPPFPNKGSDFTLDSLRCER